MTTPFIVLCDDFCFEISDFTNLIYANSHPLSEIITYLDPLVKDGVLLNWLESCEDSSLKSDIIHIVKHSINNQKSTEYILRRVIQELQLTDR